MNASSVFAQLRVTDLIPPSVLRRVTDHPFFLREITRYSAMNDEALYQVTEVCLKNVSRLDPDETGPDADLRCVLVPELWERLRPGTGARDALRRITTSSAEPNDDRPSIFDRFLLLSAEARARSRAHGAALRAHITVTTNLSVQELVEQTRFALIGSHASDKWPPDYSVYEPGFTYRVVPAVAWRALVRARAGST